jgi:Protein O-mannosyl-transferase TMEM260-like
MRIIDKNSMGAGFAFLAALIVYIFTLSPTVTLIDSGELILAAYSPGIAHPPGFPLYVLIGHLFSLLPFGIVAWRLNFMSAFFAAGAAAVIFMIVNRFLRPSRSFLPGLIASLSCAFSLTLWGYGVVAEVYTLNVFLSGVMIWFFLAWRTRRLLEREAAGPAATRSDNISTRGLLAPAFLYGLALGNHHVTILLLAPAFIYLVTTVEGWRFPISRRAIPLYLALALGLGVYLYLPLRAAQKPLLNWGDPSTWSNFFRHVAGKQYHGEQFSLASFSHLQKQALYFLRLWIRQFTPVGFVVVLLGLASIRRRDRRLFRFTILIAVFSLVYAINYDIASDIEAYYLPVFLVSAIWLGCGVLAVLTWCGARNRMLKRAAYVILLLLPVAVLAVNYRYCDRSRDFIARDYAINTLNSIEPGGLLLTKEWQLYSPLLYLQRVEGIRPDVAVIDTSLLRRSWYFDYLHREYPVLMGLAAGPVEAFREQLELFENGLPHDGNLVQDSYIEMLNVFISGQLASGPAYLTMPAEEGMGAGYSWVPSGLAFRLYPEKDPPPPGDIELDLRGWQEDSVRLSPEALHVRRNYALMLVN